MLETNRDITERKRAEQERERLLESENAARREAEHANHAKDEFLALLSHSFARRSRRAGMDPYPAQAAGQAGRS